MNSPLRVGLRLELASGVGRLHHDLGAVDRFVLRVDDLALHLAALGGRGDRIRAPRTRTNASTALRGRSRVIVMALFLRRNCQGIRVIASLSLHPKKRATSSRSVGDRRRRAARRGTAGRSPSSAAAGREPPGRRGPVRWRISRPSPCCSARMASGIWYSPNADAAVAR